MPCGCKYPAPWGQKNKLSHAPQLAAGYLAWYINYNTAAARLQISWAVPILSLDRRMGASNYWLDLFAGEGAVDCFRQKFREGCHGIWLCLVVVLPKRHEINVFGIQ